MGLLASARLGEEIAAGGAQATGDTAISWGWFATNTPRSLRFEVSTPRVAVSSGS